MLNASCVFVIGLVDIGIQFIHIAVRAAVFKTVNKADRIKHEMYVQIFRVLVNSEYNLIPVCIISGYLPAHNVRIVWGDILIKAHDKVPHFAAVHFLKMLLDKHDLLCRAGDVNIIPAIVSYTNI